MIVGGQIADLHNPLIGALFFSDFFVLPCLSSLCSDFSQFFFSMFSCVVRFQDQRADEDEDDAAADGVQAEGLSNGDFQFPVLILLL